MIDAHKLTTLSAYQVGPAAMAVIDRLQKEPKEIQAGGIACAFLAFCWANNQHPGTVLNVAERILDDKAVNSTELKALKQYIGVVVK